MTKTAIANIEAVSLALTFNAQALNSLGTGGTFPDIKDTTLTYTHKGITSDGTLVITVTIKKGEASDTATFNIKVTGIAQAKAIKDAQTDIDNVVNNFKKSKDEGGLSAVADPQNPQIINPISGVSIMLPSLTKWDNFKSNMPDILTYYEITITYTIESPNDNDGTLVVKAEIAKGLAISKVVRFKLSGFLTPSNAVKYSISAFKWQSGLSAVDALEKPTVIKITTLPSASTTRPSELNGKTTPAEIGFKAPVWYDDTSLEDNFKVNIAYNVESYDDVAGTLIVKAIITRPGANPGIVKFKVGGFLSDQGVINKAAKAFKTNLNAVDASKYPWDINDSSLDEKINVLPSDLKKLAVTPEAIGFTEPTKYNTTITYAILDFDDHDGTLIVKATIIKGKATPKIVKFKVGGFKITPLSDQEAVDKVAANLKKSKNEGGFSAVDESKYPWVAIKTNSSIDAENLSSTHNTNYATLIGFTKPINYDTIITYSFIVNQYAGFAIVEATITKGEAIQRVVRFKVEGFSYPPLPSHEIVNEITASFKQSPVDGGLNAVEKLEDVKGAIESILVDKLTISPSTLEEATTPETIGFNEPEKYGGSVTYDVESFDNKAGTLIVKATIFYEGQTSKVVWFKVGGFKIGS